MIFYSSTANIHRSKAGKGSKGKKNSPVIYIPHTGIGAFHLGESGGSLPGIYTLNELQPFGSLLQQTFTHPITQGRNKHSVDWKIPSII